LHEYFREHQIYRIDHYLAKETVQNILALRFTNTIFEPIWNRRYVDHVQITVAEDLGVEHRGTFYEQSGALRDIVQNHLLQVLALTAMEPPASFDANAIRDEKVKALRSVHPLDPGELRRHVVRGQYTRGEINGVEGPGYREEEGVSPDSKVETSLAIELDVDNWRWAGVPFYVRTGKRLPHRVTEVALRYKPVPFLPLPPTAVHSVEPNTLVLHIQPDEGITLEFAAKVPGTTLRGRGVDLDFRDSHALAEEAPEAYERVLGDAFLGDATLFIRADEVDQAWRIVQPLIDAFETGSVPLHFYPAGTWGPKEGGDLLAESYGDTWRTPCASNASFALSITYAGASPRCLARRPLRHSRCREARRRATVTNCCPAPTSTGAESTCSAVTSDGSRSRMWTRTRAWLGRRSSTGSGPAPSTRCGTPATPSTAPPMPTISCCADTGRSFPSPPGWAPPATPRRCSPGHRRSTSASVSSSPRATTNTRTPG